MTKPDSTTATREQIHAHALMVLRKDDLWLTSAEVHADIAQDLICNRLQVVAVLEDLHKTQQIGHQRDRASDLWHRSPTEPVAESAVPAPRADEPAAVSPAAKAPRAPHGESKAKVAELLRQNPGLTIKQVAQQLGLAHGTIAYHFKTLQAGAVDTRAQPKPVEEFLHSRKPKPPAVTKRRTERPLDAELTALAARFAPLTHLPEKVAVLDQLASSITGKVGALLVEIRNDLTRIGA